VQVEDSSAVVSLLWAGLLTFSLDHARAFHEERDLFPSLTMPECQVSLINSAALSIIFCTCIPKHSGGPEFRI